MFSFRFDGASNWNNEPLDMRVSSVQIGVCPGTDFTGTMLLFYVPK